MVREQTVFTSYLRIVDVHSECTVICPMVVGRLYRDAKMAALTSIEPGMSTLKDLETW